MLLRFVSSQLQPAS